MLYKQAGREGQAKTVSRKGKQSRQAERRKQAGKENRQARAREKASRKGKQGQEGRADFETAGRERQIWRTNRVGRIGQCRQEGKGQQNRQASYTWEASPTSEEATTSLIVRMA